jgi:hypothetical protein
VHGELTQRYSGFSEHLHIHLQTTDVRLERDLLMQDSEAAAPVLTDLLTRAMTAHAESGPGKSPG